MQEKKNQTEEERKQKEQWADPNNPTAPDRRTEDERPTDEWEEEEEDLDQEQEEEEE